MIKAKLIRFEQTDKQILGELSILDKTFKTLELPWRGNKKEVSCIPKGVYKCRYRYSEKYKHHFEVLDVKDRTSILIHTGNFYKHTLGCILIGLEHKDINKDGYKDVLGSTKAMEQMQLLLKKQSFELEIIHEPRISF